MKLTKFIIAITLLGITATLSAAESTHERKRSREPAKREMAALETKSVKTTVQTHYGLGTSVLPIEGQYVIAPLLTWGIRAVEGGNGVDIGATFSGIVNSGKSWMFAYQAPKLTYLTYVTPKESSSLYYGLGGSWGGIHAQDSHFDGILANGSIGYELNRNKNIRSVMQMELGYPVLPIAKHGDFKKPIIEIAYNLSF